MNIPLGCGCANKHETLNYQKAVTFNKVFCLLIHPQVKARPPTFALLLRGSTEVDEGGQRFLANVLRQSLGLEGVPLRLYLR